MTRKTKPRHGGNNTSALRGKNVYWTQLPVFLYISGVPVIPFLHVLCPRFQSFVTKVIQRVLLGSSDATVILVLVASVFLGGSEPLAPHVEKGVVLPTPRHLTCASAACHTAFWPCSVSVWRRVCCLKIKYGVWGPFSTERSQGLCY